MVDCILEALLQDWYISLYYIYIRVFFSFYHTCYRDRYLLETQLSIPTARSTSQVRTTSPQMVVQQKSAQMVLFQVLKAV